MLSSVNILNASVDGALMVGPPFVNDLHARLVTGRDAGSRSTLPVYEGGRTVRFMDESGDLEQTPGPWGPTRVVYLQHASDPVTYFSTDLAFERPAWLRDDERGPDVSERMGWFPRRDDVAGARRHAERRRGARRVRAHVLCSSR